MATTQASRRKHFEKAATNKFGKNKDTSLVDRLAIPKEELADKMESLWVSYQNHLNFDPKGKASEVLKTIEQVGDAADELSKAICQLSPAAVGMLAECCEDVLVTGIATDARLSSNHPQHSAYIHARALGGPPCP